MSDAQKIREWLVKSEEGVIHPFLDETNHKCDVCVLRKITRLLVDACGFYTPSKCECIPALPPCGFCRAHRFDRGQAARKALEAAAKVLEGETNGNS